VPRDLYLNGKKITVDPNKQVGEGKESEVYDLDGKNVLLLFKDETHPDNVGDRQKEDAARKALEIMQTKLRAFPQNMPAYVVVPQDFVTNQAGTKIMGYTMPYIKDAWPLRSFTKKAFRRANGITNDTILEIFRRLHLIVSRLHQRDIIIGDFQPDNILVDRNNQPYLIDTHSFQFGGYQCCTFEPSFADPLLCDSEAKDIKMIRPHTQYSDWYAYTAMLMQTLLCCHPYEGRYIVRTRDRKKRIIDRLRPLHRITVFHQNVLYPEDAISYEFLSGVLLYYFYTVFEQDRRGVFPSYLLDIRWKKCDTCRIEHAKQRCPLCFPGTPDTKRLMTVYGNVTAWHIFATTGRILAADVQDGQLWYLYYESGQYRREDGSITRDQDRYSRLFLENEDCIIGTARLRATNEGIIRMDHSSRITRSFPDTKLFVNAASKLLAGPGGIYVVNEQSIMLLFINQSH